MKLAVIGGDGIGPEVTAEALKVLRAVRSDIETTEYDLGARRYLRNGELLTDADLKSLREHDAILLGAIGAPGEVPPGVLERGISARFRGINVKARTSMMSRLDRLSQSRFIYQTASRCVNENLSWLRLGQKFPIKHSGRLRSLWQVNGHEIGTRHQLP